MTRDPTSCDTKHHPLQLIPTKLNNNFMVSLVMTFLDLTNTSPSSLGRVMLYEIHGLWDNKENSWEVL